MRLRRILLPLAALLPACTTLEPTATEVRRQTFYVAPYTRTCTGVIEMQCMLVRETRDGEWLNFYSQIEGFTYEPGYEYVLLVGSSEVRNPPADGSSRVYRLIQQVEKKPAT